MARLRAVHLNSQSEIPLNPKNRAAIIDFLGSRFGYDCQHCGCFPDRRLKNKNKPGSLTIDHIIPIKHKGKNLLNNFQILCWECNQEKGSKMEKRTHEEEADDRDWNKMQKEIRALPPESSPDEEISIIRRYPQCIDRWVGEEEIF